MQLTGELLINGQSYLGKNGAFYALEAATGQNLPVAFGGATLEDLKNATNAAWQAFPHYRETALSKRAYFLETIADNIANTGETLIALTMAETGLPKMRLEGERMRTVNQLRMFAAEIRKGNFMDVRHDRADPMRQPLPKPSLVYRNMAIGPVAVFGASNFPFAFSVAGGDSAAALAAGCPIIVKAHSAHPGTSEIIGRCIQEAVRICDMPAGTFALLQTTSRDIAQNLVADPYIRAVGFTGSRVGGVALMDIAAKRRQPIPVYAEMSSINPVILMPNSLATHAEDIGKAFVASLCMGAGQFCTNPGLILAVDASGYQRFVSSASAAVESAPAQTMLTAHIAKTYQQQVSRLASNSHVKTCARGQAGSQYQCQVGLFEVNAANFLNDHSLHDEIFGAASLIVKCRDQNELIAVLNSLEGQLTVALHMTDDDKPLVNQLRPILEIMAGRLLINSFGTGVEVSPAMVHGGPFPATSDGRSTSVGTAAIYRFLRSVCYQDFDNDILPELLKK